MSKSDQEAVERIRVHVLADGRMDRENAAVYLGRKPKTLAQWVTQGKGPRHVKVGGRVFYYKIELDRFVRGESPEGRTPPLEIATANAPSTTSPGTTTKEGSPERGSAKARRSGARPPARGKSREAAVSAKVATPAVEQVPELDAELMKWRDALALKELEWVVYIVEALAGGDIKIDICRGRHVSEGATKKKIASESPGDGVLAELAAARVRLKDLRPGDRHVLAIHKHGGKCEVAFCPAILSTIKTASGRDKVRFPGLEVRARLWPQLPVGGATNSPEAGNRAHARVGRRSQVGHAQAPLE